MASTSPKNDCQTNSQTKLEQQESTIEKDQTKSITTVTTNSNIATKKQESLQKISTSKVTQRLAPLLPHPSTFGTSTRISMAPISSLSSMISRGPPRLLPLAPAPIVTNVHNYSQQSSCSLDADRRRKAELRRARNRESAQRSNHRRKLRLQALKDAILRAERDANRLREREKALRARNVQLKACVER